MRLLDLTNVIARRIRTLGVDPQSPGIPAVRAGSASTGTATVLAAMALLVSPGRLATQNRETLKPALESETSAEFSLPFCRAQASVTIELPKELEVTHARGPDFDLFVISGTKKQASMTIYIGHAPEVQHPAGAALRSLAIGTTDARVYAWTEKRLKAKSYERELLIDWFFPRPGLQVPMSRPGHDAPSTFPPKPPVPGVPVLPAPTCEQGAVVHLRASGPEVRAVDRLIDSARTIKKGGPG